MEKKSHEGGCVEARSDAGTGFLKGLSILILHHWL